jgi:predicted  nucleic acid-binding Zn-ribbon protein
LSPLSKVFVVLLVVCSMLTTAATVVFVNKVTVTEQSLQAATAAANAQKKANDAAIATANADSASAANALAVAQGQIAALHASLDDANKAIGAANLTIAQDASDKAIQEANISRLSQGLAAAQSDNGKLSDMVTDLRSVNDKLQKNANDLDAAVADKENLYETANKDLQFAREQLQALQDKNNKLSAAVEKLGGNPNELDQTASGPTPAINGVVRDIKDIGGVTYATISVGSADSVSKGMQFYVVDRSQGKFLGIVTIDYVDTNEATGRLTGPPDTVSMVHSGTEVKTNFE